jgi:hypothetical protein
MKGRDQTGLSLRKTSNTTIADQTWSLRSRKGSKIRLKNASNAGIMRLDSRSKEHAR